MILLCCSYSQFFPEINDWASPSFSKRSCSYVCVCINRLVQKVPRLRQLELPLTGSAVSLRLSSNEAMCPGLSTSMALMHYYPAERVPVCLSLLLRAPAHVPFEMQIREKPRFEFLTCSSECVMGVLETLTHVVHHVMNDYLALFSRPGVT